MENHHFFAGEITISGGDSPRQPPAELGNPSHSSSHGTGATGSGQQTRFETNLEGGTLRFE
jgi:hypothetical protein